MRVRLLSAAVLLSLLVVALASRGGTTEPSPVPDTLHAMAAAQGTVKVIVRLNAPFTPEGQLASPAHVASQRQTLAGSQALVRNHLRGISHRVARDFGGRLPLLAIEASPDALRLLASLRGVVADVQEDVAVPPSLAQSIPLINANDVWNLGFDGTDQIVAILDTGVLSSHNFFPAGKIIAEACFSTNGSGGTSVCPGGAESAFGAGAGQPCDLSVEGCEHGTHVAGIAAGTGASFSGVAKGANIIAIQVFSRFDDFFICGGFPPCALSFSSDQIEALNYVHAQRQIFPGKRIAAVNMSLGGDGFPTPCNSAPQKAAIDQLRTPHASDPTDRGVATVIAAGNSGFTDAISTPGCISTAIPVASSTKSDGMSSFSNMASPSIFANLLVAPGSSINSSVPPASTFASFSGTSMAAPHVAGTFAVLRQLAPTATVDELVNLLKTTGKPITDTRPPCGDGCDSSGATGPRIDVLAAAAPLSTPNLIVQTLTAPTVGVPGANISVTTSIRNTSIGPADPSNLGLYLSTDNVITTGDVFLGTIAFNALNGGTTSPVATLSVQIPSGTAAGSYFIGAIADADAQLDEINEADNTKAVAIQIALPDLTVTTITSTPVAVAPGQNVSVMHTVKNLAGASAPAPASTSRLFLSDNATFDGGDVSLGTVSVATLAGGASTSVTKSLQIPGNTSAGQYWIIAVANDGPAFVEGNTGNNTLATTTPFLIGPDLIVTAATAAPLATAPGMNVSVTSTVKNQGGSAAGPFDVGIYLSTNNTYDDGVDLLLATRRVTTSLAAAGTSTATTTVTIPGNLSAATYFLIVRADITGSSPQEVAEANESNNTRATAALQVVRPDLTVLSVTAPGVAAPGANISVSHVVKNLALAAGGAGATTTRLYLSPDAVLDVGSDVVLGDAAVGTLAGGAMATVTKSVGIPGGTSPGLYWVVAQANVTNSVQEVDSPTQANNVKATATPIIVGPDLIVTAATAAPVSTAPGMNVSVTKTIKNQGGQAAGPFDVGVYLSTNNVFDGGDLLVTSGRVGGLAPGATFSGALPFVMPSNLSAGTYFLIVRADITGSAPQEVAEANETNNALATTPIQVVRPDLTVQSVAVPGVIAPGANVSVSHVVKNLAAAAGGAGATTSRLYLSPDAVLDVGSDVVLGDAPVGALAGGAMATVTKTVAIPGGTTPGLYWIIAQANATNTVQEADSPTQANNAKATATPIIVGPDLVVTAATAAPLAIAPGMNVSVTNTVKNQGAPSAGPFDVGIYLSTNNTYDDGVDLLIGGRRVSAGLAAGAMSAATTPVTIPGNLSAGTYFLIVRADITGSAPQEVTEANETNNALATAALQVVRPDLAVQSVTVPGVIAPGANVSVSHVVKNLAAAAGAAGVTTTRLYLSSDAVLDGSDVVLGDAAVGALAGGAMATVAKTVAIPGGTASGLYWIIAQANATNTVQEVDSPTQANNVKATATPVIIGPDLLVTAATPTPLAIAPGMNVSVASTVKNQGTTAGAFDVGIYLSTNNTYDDGVDVQLGTRRVTTGLASGAVSTATTPVTIPGNLSAGTYFLIVRADITGSDPQEVVEANEANNTLSTAAVQVVRPDLSVLSVTAPTVSAPGANISVSHVVKNLALPAGAAGTSTSRLYLSPDAVLDVGSDVVLADASVGALAGGAMATVAKTVTIPGGTTPGLYWIIAQANVTNTVLETDSPTQANDVKATATPIIVGPDLVVTASTGPTLVGPGGSFPVTTTVKNQGGQAANSSVLRFFLAQTGQPDLLLAANRSVPTLAPGALSGPLATTVTIPTNVSAGTYFIKVEADGLGAVDEADESNNVRPTANFSVQLPNIQIVSITIPAAVIRGRVTGSPSASIVVKNIGTGPSAPFAVQVFANRDDGSGGADDPGSGDLLFTKTVAALAPNAMATVTGAIVIPETVSSTTRLAGNYFVSATADPTGAATGDTSLGDNAMTLTSKKLPVLPDMTKLHNVTAPLSLTPACGVTSLNLTGTINFTSQSVANPSSFSGSVTLSDLGVGFSAVYSISGTGRAVDSFGTAGAINSTFTYSRTGESGSGTITGSAADLNFTGGVITGQSSSLPGCTFSGTIDITR